MLATKRLLVRKIPSVDTVQDYARLWPDLGGVFLVPHALFFFSGINTNTIHFCYGRGKKSRRVHTDLRTERPLGLVFYETNPYPRHAPRDTKRDYAESAISGREAKPMFGLGRVVGCRLIGQRLRQKLVHRHRQADCLERPHQWAGQTSAGMLESTGASLSRAHAGSTLVGGRLRCDT